MKTIFDIGVGSGQDTYFYLKKGFKVVGVEADPIQFEQLKTVFSNEILNGSLVLINAVASNTTQKLVKFFRNETRQYTSSIAPADSTTEYEIISINYESLVNQFGTPYYCKIDIEGSDIDFIPNAIESLPSYMSAEVWSGDVIDKLYQIGYTKFKLVSYFYTLTLYNNYVYTGSFGNILTEGLVFDGKFPNWLNVHGLTEWAGLFGKELNEEWFTYTDIKRIYIILQNFQTKFSGEATGACAAYDCHATI
jgi:FkbM family methyltransferase